MMRWNLISSYSSFEREWVTFWSLVSDISDSIEERFAGNALMLLRLLREGLSEDWGLSDRLGLSKLRIKFILILFPF